jgi:hypothetical protein
MKLAPRKVSLLKKLLINLATIVDYLLVFVEKLRYQLILAFQNSKNHIAHKIGLGSDLS